MNQAQIDSAGESRGSFNAYATGFVLSLVLTVIPFALVMREVVSGSTAFFCLIGAAIAQILVHLHYFLHLDTSSSARWNELALLFTVLIMALFVGGTIWIMVHLQMNYRVM